MKMIGYPVWMPFITVDCLSSAFSNKDESPCIDIVIFEIRNELLYASRNGMLTLPRYMVLNVTEISTCVDNVIDFNSLIRYLG
jgi:hypothetical protein